ncbi:MAG TPA: NYN domain-containing protein [Candidatus Limnocylindria bacterium]|nr:NYN domain-containing protein [Candidatus Limnocylindria bacterium]
MPHQDRLNIAVFIDFDNIEIGIKSTLGENFDVGAILDALKERGEVVTKIAYADWTRAGEYSRHLTQHAIRLVQRNLTPGGDKNGADINLALDALEMAFTHPHINAYVIVGGDSDFLSLVEKLKQYDKKVFVVGGRAFTSIILQRNCHEFIAYENLTGGRRSVAKGGRPVAPAASAPIAQAFPIVRRALKILSDREVSPQTGLLKSTLLQLDSTFSERTYGASSFLDFVEKLAQSGLAQLKHTGRSVMVELNEKFHESESSTAAAVAASGPVALAEARDEVRAAAPEAETEPGVVMAKPVQASRPAPSEALVVGAGAQADGVRLVGQILTAATAARWPMYLRNVKQLLRAAEGGFDERRYGFMGLIDLLRGCQSEGLVRLERDRRGGLRVFKGPALQETGPSPAIAPSQEVVEAEPLYTQPLETVDRFELEERAEEDRFNVEPMPIDTTAELLGRAKQRRPRARVTAAAPPAAARVPRKAASKKAAPGASTRSRKPARSAAPGKKEN